MEESWQAEATEQIEQLDRVAAAEVPMWARQASWGGARMLETMRARLRDALRGEQATIGEQVTAEGAADAAKHRCKYDAAGVCAGWEKTNGDKACGRLSREAKRKQQQQLPAGGGSQS